MAKVNAPLLSFGARGQIGKSVVFGSWRGIPYARQMVTPANPRTNEQQETRGVFRVMSQLWTLAPVGWKTVWDEFAKGRPFTGRNRLIGDNVRALRGEDDYTNFVFSPGARGGLPADGIVATGGSGTITVAVTVPDIPPGWTLTNAQAVALLDQDPAMSYQGPVGYELEDVDPSEVTLTGLDTAGDYIVGVYLQWEKPSGETAYSIAVTDTATVTA